jgi:CHAD domain-containing protein
MLPGVETGDIRAIHRTRVASRRLRELLPLLELPGKTSRKLGRRLRRATRQLGHVRELDVLLMLSEELAESGKYSERAVRRVAGDVRGIRAKARKEFSTQKSAADLLKLAKNLDKVSRKLEDVETPSSGRAWHWAMDARIARRASALKRAVDSAGAIFLSERLHDVRIALKKLRYAVELSTDASGAKPGADLKTLKRVQTLLGRLHDRQVFVDRVRSVQASLNPHDAVVSHDLDALLIGLDQTCRRLHARFIRERGAVLEICERLARASPALRMIDARRPARKAG